ncbi:DUF721 domain-containing protein [Paludibacterium paludis]|uniref:DUF721 domain-containing protein n=1 Tax=Paludibacterium paludis TaxID=1225769 RepID=A0A918P0A2_9NEIS|nr:DUF721 domain-containing protein [Paludibacterium paludis]GGY09537.1 hypothetical protein GCM10011289_10430 [Paludibacterium paludis]
MFSRPLQDIAKNDALLARLTEEARAGMAIDRALKRLLPPLLAGMCHAGRIRDGELTVYADNSMIAARLRLTLPGLLPALAAAGYPASRARIKVAVRFETRRPAVKRGLSGKALDAFDKASHTIADPDLARALARLVRRHRG